MKRRPAHAPWIEPADLTKCSGWLHDPSAVFNPGGCRFLGRDRLLLRVQSRGRETALLAAQVSKDRSLSYAPEPIQWLGQPQTPEIFHLYDPRLTVLGSRCYITLAADLEQSCRTAFGYTDDFETFHWLGFCGEDDERNCVLFPDRIDGCYARLTRPNLPTSPGNPASGDCVHFSTSEDLHSWSPGRPVFAGRNKRWDERIGAGPPPILTERGWLLVYHGVATHFASSNIYQAGVVLLDRHEPWRVLGRSRNNFLEPRESFELVGQVNNVVFPSACIFDTELGPEKALPTQTPFRLFYGAADRCIGLLEGTLGELLAALDS